MKNKLIYQFIKLISFFPHSFLLSLISLLNYSVGKGFYHAGNKSVVNEIKSISKLLKKKPKIIIDIGANIGNYTEESLKNFQSAKYYLFEPNAINYQILLNKFEKYKDIEIYNYALSNNKNNDAILYSNFEGSGYASLVQRNLNHRNIDMSKIKEKVKVITLQEFLISKKLKKIDLCKIDVEGIELKVLQGAKEYINYIKIIQFEISSGQMEEKNYFKDFWFFFKKNNFDIYIITPSGPKKILRYKERDEFFDETNYIAVNNSIQ